MGKKENSSICLISLTYFGSVNSAQNKNKSRKEKIKTAKKNKNKNKNKNKAKKQKTTIFKENNK